MAFYQLNPKTINLSPPGLSNHSLTLCNTKIVVFGGNNLDPEYFSDVYIYDIQENTWMKPSTLNNEQKPEFRSNHMTQFIPPNQILIYAGEQNGLLHDDLHLFNLESSIWEEIDSLGRKPSPRYGFSHVIMPDNSIMIIAGVGGSSNLSEAGPLSDIFLLNTETFFWEEYYFKQNGFEPSGMGYHSFHLTEHDCLLCVGTDLFSIRILDLEDRLWIEVKAQGFAPTDLKGYCMSPLGKNEFFVFGGESNEELSNNSYYLEFDDEQFTWSQLLICGKKPENRKNHNCVSLGGLVVIFGGEDKDNNFSDLKVFDLSKYVEWNQANTSEEQDPIFRVQHIMVHIPDMKKILIHGGNCVGVELKDVQLYDYENQIWEYVNVRQRPLCGHAGVYWEKKKSVVIYGGGSYLREDIFDKDVSILQLNKWNYGEINVPNPPALKLGLSMFIHEEKLYTVGGFIPKFGYTMEVDCLPLPQGKEMTKWEKVPMLTPKKVAPIPRACHAMCQINNKVFMIGGVKDGIALNDIWYIELETMSWFPITIYLKFKEPIFGTVAIPIDDYNILVFGGSQKGEKSSLEQANNNVLLLNLDRNTNQEKEKNKELNDGVWSVLKTKGNFEPRMFHTGVKISDSIYIFGGCKSSKMAILKIERQERETVTSIKSIMEEKKYQELINGGTQPQKKTLLDNIFSLFKKDDEIEKTETIITEESENKKKTKKKGKKKKKSDGKKDKKINQVIEENDEYDPWGLKEDDNAFSGVYLGGDLNLDKKISRRKSKFLVDPDEDIAVIINE